jgi:hypothetical protein
MMNRKTIVLALSLGASALVAGALPLATPVAAQATLPALPAGSRELSVEEARRFVVGGLFTFSCFEGTTGEGRILVDGSAIGRINIAGSGQDRFASVPAGTLRVTGNRICASLRGLSFQPCFSVVQTGRASFRGSIDGYDGYYCDFSRRPTGRRDLVRTRAEAPVTTGSVSGRTRATVSGN